MFNFSQPFQASAASNIVASQSGWACEMDDIALGCECADPALQIASWGQEAGEAVRAAASSS